MTKIQDVEETIGLMRKLGHFKSTIVILALSFIVVWQQYKFSDRWTKTDHEEYVVRHDRNTQLLVEKEKAGMDTKVLTLSTDIKELKDEIKKMQRELGEMHATQNLMLRKIDVDGRNKSN